MTDDKKARIIDLKARQDARDSTREDIGELLAACRSISLERLSELIGTLFEKADDALFDYGEKADTNTQQMAYFDSMRELRRKRAVAERQFQQEIARAFSRFRTVRDYQIDEEVEQRKMSEDQLTLVEEDELEETLAITNMVDKAENKFSRELNGLNQRLSVLSGGSKVDVKNNPIGPASICEAFRRSTADFQLETHVRLILYKLFDRQVVSELAVVYGELNELLIEAGVLPQIKTPLRRPKEKPPKPSGRSGGRKAKSSRGDVEAPDDEEDGAMHTIRELLASRHETDHEDASAQYHYNPFDDEALMGKKPSASAYYAHLDLVNAIAVLQGEIARTAWTIRPGEMSEIKESLIEQVRKLTDSAKNQKMSRSDEDTIDLVGMLFEFILTDRNLPDTIQATLSRLQIPYLKIALMDKRFFTQRAHPARRLLDDMARAGIGWTQENDKDQRLIGKMREIVDRVLNEFDDDLDLFDDLVADFDEFISSYRRVAEVAEKRTTEATRGRERLHQARKQAAREITERIQDNELPRAVQNLLARPWANVLVLTLLRHGEDSQEWVQALQVADDVIWAVRPKADEKERTRLLELIHPLSEAIREGLTLVALHDDEVEAILADLSDCFEAVLNQEQVVESGGTGSAEETQPPEWMTEVREAEEEGPDKADIGEEYLRAVKEIPLGTWMEFIEENGEPQRAKLSWISPISQRYLFVNQKGIKIADRSREELAQALQEERATVLDDVPLFDRALDAIAEKLKKDRGSRRSPGHV